MRRCVSADNIQLNSKTKKILLKRYKCKTTRRYQTCALLGGSVLVVYNNVYHNVTLGEIGSMLTTSYFTLAFFFSYVDNYLMQLDEWRNNEAGYEDKSDPPEWNWKILNNISHIAVVLNLLASVSDDIGVFNVYYYYVGTLLQLAAVCCKLYYDRSRKTLLTSGLNISSMASFVINKTELAALLYLFAEILSL